MCIHKEKHFFWIARALELYVWGTELVEILIVEDKEAQMKFWTLGKVIRNSDLYLGYFVKCQD